jgi:transcriptional regulator with XRE-family HTH domain
MEHLQSSFYLRATVAQSKQSARQQVVASEKLSCQRNTCRYAESMLPTTPQKRISALIKAKRREGGLGVRAAAAASGVSAATLSRLERGITPNLPDAGTLTRLANWLGVTLNELLATGGKPSGEKRPETTTPEVVEVHLRADKNLSPETAEALAKMFKVLYDNATTPKST